MELRRWAPIVCLVAGCADLDPLEVTACRVDADCLDGRRCVEAACTTMAPLEDAGVDGDAGLEPDAGLDGCIPEVAEDLGCVDQIFCGLLVDGDIESVWETNCLEAPEGPGCNPEGIIEQFDLRLSFPGPTTVRGVRFLTDWFSRRPIRYELWGASTATATPERGATRVVAAEAHGPPWLCVDGLPCDYLTPDVCCPNGREQPIDTANAQAQQSKYDFAGFAAARAQYWTLRLIGSDGEIAVALAEVELLTSVCVNRL